ncbi:MAG: hypothetical protein DRJ03_10095 [Chloroflexi bacterium]|nr:MAG: hypothetical protein DRJ03_10095 [Chloroflexota bacterium]
MESRKLAAVLVPLLVLGFLLMPIPKASAAEQSLSGTLNVGVAAPTVQALELYDTSWTAVTAMDPYTEYWLNITVYHPNTLMAIINITVYIYDNTTTTWDGADDVHYHATYVWDNTTKEWSLVGPTGTLWSVDTADSSYPDQSQTSGTWTLAFVPSKVAHASTNWVINATAWGSGDLSDDLSITKTMNFYAEISLTDTSFDFGSVSPGTNNASLVSPTDGDIDYTIIANDAHDVGFYTDGNWTSGANEIDITNTNYFIGDDDSSPTEATETGIDPWAIHPTPSVTKPYTNVAITSESGDTYATYLFQTVPEGTPSGTYTLTLYIQVVQSA